MIDNNDEELDQVHNSIKNEDLKNIISRWSNENDYSVISSSDIKFWNYYVEGESVYHSIRTSCKKCSESINQIIELPLAYEPSTAKFICPSCLQAHTFSDKYLADYFLNRIDKSVKKINKKKGKPKIAFIMRYTQVFGGGTKVIFKHMHWLAKLGCKITIYSNDKSPTWTKLPGRFIQVTDHYKIDTIDADLVVVFTVYDVPKILTKFNNEKVVHFCQGYEGYHIGKDFEDLRADKHFYTQIHSLPVKNVLASKHLMELFKTKFKRDGYYVPNGINFSIYHPMPEIMKEQNSILFVGNPRDPLKGIDFLIKSLAHLKSEHKEITDLTLYIVWGGTGKAESDNVKEVRGLKIVKPVGLTPREMAKLMNKVSLVVNTSWYEGFTLPVLEAMACGTPVITTNNMGAESFCKDGYNSYVVQYGDAETFANRTAEILLKKSEVSQMIKNGFYTAVEYSELNSFDKFVETYGRLLGRHFETKLIEELRLSYEINEEKLFGLLNAKMSLSEDRFINYFEEALKNIESKNYEAALEYIDKSLDVFHSSKRTGYEEVEYMDVLNLGGNIALTVLDLFNAKKYFEEELKHNPNSSRACLGLGEVFYNAELYKESKTMFEWSIKLSPENQAGVSGLALVNKKLGLEESDNQLFKNSFEEKILQAEEFIQSNRISEARNVLIEIIEKEPHNIDALNDLSVVELLDTNYESAAVLISKVIDIDKTNVVAIDNFNFLQSQISQLGSSV